MSVLETIKLGRPNAEAQFDGVLLDAPNALQFDPAKTSTVIRNVQNEGFVRTFRKRSSTFSIGFPQVGEQTAQIIESLAMIDDSPLSLVWANSRPIFSERIILDTANTLTLPSTSETLLGAAYVAAGGGHGDIIAVSGVFAGYSASGAQLTTNYYTGGSYNATTRTVTLGSSPGAAGTAVYVNWTYRGALVALNKSNKFKAVSGTPGPMWDISLELEGL